jgi:hypothetical protein
MALNIDLVNGGINIYETGETPRTYFGAIGASGKIYPSGSVTQGANTISLLQNNAVDLSDGDYEGLSVDGTSGSGIGATVNVYISSGEITGVSIDSPGNGYAIGDTLTVDASVFGGTGSIILKVDSLLIDSILFVVGGDDYQVQWANLLINGTSPANLSDAMTLLSTLLIGVSGQPYKVYTAILNQSTNNAPVATVLQNTIHPDLTWGYNASGRYGLSAGGSINLFNIDGNITTTTIQGILTISNGAVIGSIYGEVDDSTVYKIYVWSPDSADYADGILTNYTFEIRVYN